MNANACKELLERLGASLNEIEERLHNLPAKASERGQVGTTDGGSRYAKESGVFEGGVIGAEFDVRRARERLSEIIEEFFGSEEMSETAKSIGEMCRPVAALNSWRKARGV